MIGKNIKNYRKEKGWSQDELAKKTGMSKISIGNYERGNRCPTVETLQKIADAFEVPVNHLINNIAHQELSGEGVKNHTEDGLLTYLHQLSCETYPTKENGKRGYFIDMKKESNGIFIDYETLDRVEAMIEADIKKLLVSFGVAPSKIDGEW